MKIICVTLGHSKFALPYSLCNMELATNLLHADVLVQEYKNTASGNYEQVYCRPSYESGITIVDNAEAFDGTIKEYREQPKTYNDLVADLSVMSEKIADLEAALEAERRTALGQPTEDTTI